MTFTEERGGVAAVGGAAFSEGGERGVGRGEGGQPQSAAQQREGAGDVGGAHAAAGVLAPAGVTAPVVAVLDAPVLAGGAGPTLRRALARIPTGGEAALRLTGLAGLLERTGRVQFDGLTHTGQPALLGLQRGDGDAANLDASVSRIAQGKKGVSLGTAKRVRS